MRFHKAYIEITNICGLECSFCPSKESLNPQTMPLELFEKTLIELKSYTNLIALHIFGDPLCISNLKEYLDMVSKHHLQAEITTTGVYLSSFPLDLFLDPAIRQINFSLNSFNKNSMKLTLEEYLAPMLRLCDLKLQKKVHNFINFRLWNQDENNSEEEFNKSVFNYLEKKVSCGFKQYRYFKAFSS
jgi:organic radical activating enzyme